MTAVVGLFLAGLALFFYSVAGIRANLQQLTGRKFRGLLSRWTKNGWLAAAWGFVFGAVTQSATAVSFILASLISSGTMTVPRALMIVGWANVGTALLVFLAAIDVHLVVLYLLGLTGLAVTFEVAPRLKPTLAALFSVGLLFIGLNMMRQAFAPLPELAWFQAVAEFAQGSDLAAAAIGMLLRTVIQSASAIAVLAVTLSHAGLITDTQVIMMMFGAALGVTLSSYLLSSELRGVPRQIVLFHGAINGISGLVCIGLVLLEKATGWPLIVSWVAAAQGDGDTRLSVAFLLLMLGVAAVATLSARRAPQWLNRWSPPTVEQDLSRPQHLLDEALQDPETALELVEREEESLLGSLPSYLQSARDQRAQPLRPADSSRDSLWRKGATDHTAVRHRAFTAVAAAVEEYCTSLADQNLSRPSSSRLLGLEQRLGTLAALDENLYGFAARAVEQSRDGEIGQLIDNLIEAADTVLLTAIDCWKTRERGDLDLLMAMTEDRGGMMERIRRTYLDREIRLDHSDQAGLFHLTSLFERIVWLLRQVVVSLREMEAT